MREEVNGERWGQILAKLRFLIYRSYSSRSLLRFKHVGSEGLGLLRNNLKPVRGDIRLQLMPRTLRISASTL